MSTSVSQIPKGFLPRINTKPQKDTSELNELLSSVLLEPKPKRFTNKPDTTVLVRPKAVYLNRQMYITELRTPSSSQTVTYNNTPQRLPNLLQNNASRVASSDSFPKGFRPPKSDLPNKIPCCDTINTTLRKPFVHDQCSLKSLSSVDTRRRPSTSLGQRFYRYSEYSD